MLTTRSTLAALLLAAAGAASAAAQTIDTLSLRAHTRYLADDMLLGRGTGTEGERLAAAYIVSQLERSGLRGAGPDGAFLLPVPLRTARIEDDSHISFALAEDTSTWDHGLDFVMGTGGQGAFRDFRGLALLLGEPEHALDRIRAERSLVGRVAVFLAPLGTAAQQVIPALSHAGAAGAIVLTPDPTTFDLYVRSRGEIRYFVDGPVGEPVWQPALPVVIAGPAMTAALLQNQPVPDALLDGSATEGHDLGVTVIARIRTTSRAISGANVAALLPGSDPDLGAEYIAYTAHYDHLGIGSPDAAGDSIYNGFSDNAAGVAMLLAIAEQLRRQPPARSVLFLFFTGEERGLLGSAYFAANPTVPLDRLVGLINLDAGAPPAPPVSWRIAGGTDGPGASLGLRAQRLAARLGWSVNLSPPSPNSDYWPFLLRGVPSIFLIPGDEWENTSPARRDALRRRWDRYHRPDDHFHTDFPFAGLQRYAEFALMIGLDLANGM